MNERTQIILAISVFAAIFLFYFIRRQMIIHRNRCCPRCGHRMEVIWESRDVDPRKERVRIGGTRILSGNVKEYKSVIHCGICKYEIPL